jgi:4-amino-4-deoxy-L-arabinose transferase-like glycosyltransferase
MAVWTLWRWRKHLTERHLAVPLGCVLVSLVACIAMGGSDRALMLTLPPLAVLASFALPTLRRSTSAAVDWFSVFFFSVCALSMWVVYISLQTGVPATPAANVARRLSGYTSSFSMLSLIVAALGTLAWVWLVRWRTGRHRNPLWKSLVLPASGVALCWLLLTTLWLPMLDYARSYRPLIDRLVRHVPKDQCVNGWALPRGQIAALEYMGGYQVDAVNTPALSRCDILMRLEARDHEKAPIAGWTLVAREQRPSDRDELTAIYRRNPTR